MEEGGEEEEEDSFDNSNISPIPADSTSPLLAKSWPALQEKINKRGRNLGGFGKKPQANISQSRGGGNTSLCRYS